MDKEKEICDMAEVIKNSVYSQPIGERTLRTEIELAMALWEAGYGNVKQAVKEFTEKFKDCLIFAKDEIGCFIRMYNPEDIKIIIDNLITELYGADE